MYNIDSKTLRRKLYTTKEKKASSKILYKFHKKAAREYIKRCAAIFSACAIRTE